MHSISLYNSKKMMSFRVLKGFGLFIALTLIQLTAGAKLNNHPEQVHLSLGTDGTEMLVTWATLTSVPDTSVVEFGGHKTDLHTQVKAEVVHFKEELTDFYTYRAKLTDLKPGATYHYRVGSPGSGWTDVFNFRAIDSSPNWNPRMVIYGDLGYQNEVSLPFLTKEVVDHDAYDVLFHVGDIAYNLHTNDGDRGNKFMRSIESIAAQIPYMVCPGNHEKHDNFSHYDARFSMLGDRHTPNPQAPLTHRLNNHFYSVDLGPAHVILFSTEFYYYTNYGWDQIERQYHFLEEDLKRANANRAQRPWIIVMGHRPLYCLKGGHEEDEDEDQECNQTTMERPIVREGVHMRNNTHSPLQYGLEDLFYKYGVDIQFYGHEHYYGRLLPLYNSTVKSGTKSTNPYENPTGPIHIITGSAGNKQEHPKFNPDLKSWVAHHNLDYGYTKLIFKDKTHIVLEQTSDDKAGAIVDHIDIIKHNEKPLWLA